MKRITVALIIFSLKLTTIFCECKNSEILRDVAFIKIGQYRGFTDKGAEYQKTYFVNKHLRTNWFEAKVHCISSDLELASFETLAEVQNFINIAKIHPFVIQYGGKHMIVDGMTITPNTTTEWYWTNSGTKVSFSLPWQKGEPNFTDNGEYCLAISANEPSTLGFNDYPCHDGTIAFVCQRVDYFIPVRAN